MTSQLRVLYPFVHPTAVPLMALLGMHAWTTALSEETSHAFLEVLSASLEDPSRATSRDYAGEYQELFRTLLDRKDAFKGWLLHVKLVCLF